MNSSQRRSVQASLDKLSKINILGVAGAVYTNDADSVMIDGIPLPIAVSLLRDFIKEINYALEDGDKWKNMSYYESNDRSVDIKIILDGIIDDLQNRIPFEFWFSKVKWLDRYGVHNKLRSKNIITNNKIDDEDLSINNLHLNV